MTSYLKFHEKLKSRGDLNNKYIIMHTKEVRFKWLENNTLLASSFLISWTRFRLE